MKAYDQDLHMDVPQQTSSALDLLLVLGLLAMVYYYVHRARLADLSQQRYQTAMWQKTIERYEASRETFAREIDVLREILEQLKKHDTKVIIQGEQFNKNVNSELAL